MTHQALTELADRLTAYNAWRRVGPGTDGYDPEPFQIGMDIEAAIQVIRLAAVPTDEHLYEGDCPDQLQPDARDPECPACRRMGPAA